MDAHTKTVFITTAAVLWTTAGSFAVAGTVYDNMRLMMWGVLTASVACMVTAHLIARCATYRERIRLEVLVEGMVATARQRAEVPHLHGPRR